MTENTHLAKELNNINIETVENCNLLCKLVMDYVSTDKCTIEVVKNNTTSEDKDKRSFRIVYPPGSFINYRDTSYELTYAYFFYPSRHSIDGERYDLEVNIYHGNYRNGDNKRGMVAHTHYHMDEEDTSNQHKHFHYHLPSDKQNDVHKEDEKHNEKNIVTCLLYNMGKHTGSDVNIFFNQFIHHPDFKKLKIKGTDDINITVHDNWSIEKIYPKKRSYFLYDGKNEDKNTYVVFDTIQTISKEIIDRLYERGIKNANEGETGFDINGLASYNVKKLTNVFYRKNIEVITDEQYKKIKRAQINDLLSLTRMSTYKPVQRTSKEYNEISQGIVESISGGGNTGYLTDEPKAKRVSDHWDYYGKDKPIEKKASEVGAEDYEKLILNEDTFKKYDYINILYEHFKDQSDELFDKDSSDFESYITKKKALYDLVGKYVRDPNNLDKINPDLLSWLGNASSVIEDAAQAAVSEPGDLFNNIRDVPKYKVRFFLEELDPNFNSENDIQQNLYGVLPYESRKNTVTQFFVALRELNDNELYDKLIFAITGETMNRTLSNEECQEWLSNETHYEGSLWKFWEKPVTLSKNQKYTWEQIRSLELRKKIGEGMIKWADTDETEHDEDGKPKIKWQTHNECRNPGNRSAAPWCYTKNPNKRWEYCSKPVYSDILGKIVLFLIFIFLGVVAFLTIKTFFLHEYPMAWVAKLTGGTFASKDTFAGKGAGASPAAGASGPPKTK